MSAADSLNIVEFDGQPATIRDTNWPFDALRVFSNAEAATERVSTARRRDGGHRFDAVHDVWARI